VQFLTGETARDSGALILAFEKVGISADKIGTMAGLAEKNLGRLNATAVAGAGHLSKLAQIDKQYGLQLVSSSGKVVTYSELLRQLAGFYDTNASASTKAYVASQVLGRQYATLAPLLAQGSQGLRDAAAAADGLGLGSADTVKQINAFRDGMRNLGEQVNILHLGIGIDLLPNLNKLATSAASFVSGHGQDIRNLFKGAASAALTAAGTIGDLVGVVGGFWNSIPPGFRDLLIKGVVADRTVKFLFGFSPLGSVMSGIEAGLTKALGAAVAGGVAKGALTAGLGRLFVQPVFVTNMGAGFGGGSAPGAPTSPLGVVGLLAATAGIASVLYVAEQQLERLPDRLAAAMRGDIRSLITSGAATPPDSITGAVLTLAKTLMGPGMKVTDNQVADDLETLRHSIDSNFKTDVATRVDRTRAAIIAASEKNVAAQEKIKARQAATVTSLENLRHGMLAKQSTANARLAQIAAKKTTFTTHVLIPIRITNTGSTYRVTATTTSGAYAGYNGTPIRL
jgi:hypothetical protein